MNFHFPLFNLLYGVFVSSILSAHEHMFYYGMCAVPNVEKYILVNILASSSSFLLLLLMTVCCIPTALFIFVIQLCHVMTHHVLYV